MQTAKLIKLPNGTWVNPAYVTCVTGYYNDIKKQKFTRLWVVKDAGYGTGSMDFDAHSPDEIAAILNTMHIDDITLGQWKALIKELPREIQYFWDYRDELSLDQVKALTEGPDARNQMEFDIQINNLDVEWEQQKEVINEALRKLDLDELDARDVFEEIGEQGIERLMPDVNLRQLAKYTTGINMTVISNLELNFEAFRGINTSDQIKEMCEVCELLNINPKCLQYLVCDPPSRASWDDGSFEFPDHPERDGHELMPPRDFCQMLDNNGYAGNLTFLFRMRGDELMDQIEALKAGPIRIHKGTEMLIYAYWNGAGSVEGALIGDLILQPGTYEICLDAAREHGVHSCYGLTPKPWEAGHVTAEIENDE